MSGAGQSGHQRARRRKEWPAPPRPGSELARAGASRQRAPRRRLGRSADPSPTTARAAARRQAAYRRRTLRRRLLVAPITVVIVVWAVLSAVTLWRAEHQLRAGVALATQVRGEDTTTDLVSDRVGDDLDATVSRFGDAHRLLSEPWLAPLRVVPYVGRQLHSAQDLSGAAHTVSAAGSQAVTQAHGLLTAPHATPAQRAGIVRSLAGTVATLQRRTEAVDLGPSTGLLSILSAKRATFATDLTKLRQGLHRGVGSTAALADLLTGPRTYLLLVSNNAEMRDGSGTFLEVGTISCVNGKLTVGPITPTSELVDPDPTVAATGDLASLWGDVAANEDYRNLGFSPQFPANAQLAVRMWEATHGPRVDGVLEIDVAGLRSILGATGAVSGGGHTVDAGNVEQTLLEEQYVGVTTSSDYETRQGELGQLAGAIFASVQKPGVSLAQLGQGVAGAVDGRHLLAWSSDPTIESDWDAAGAAGTVSGDGMLFGLINEGADKLDPYIHVAGTVTTAATGRNTEVTVTTTISNQTPAGLSPYVTPGQGGVPYGTYTGSAVLDFPRVAGSARVNRAGVAASGADYGSDALAVNLTLPQGHTTSVTWTFLLAGHHGRLSVDPSARLPAVTWQAGRENFADTTAHTVVW